VNEDKMKSDGYDEEMNFKSFQVNSYQKKAYKTNDIKLDYTVLSQ